MKIKEEQYKQLCGKCEYLIKLPGRKVCPFVGCIKKGGFARCTQQKKP